MSVTSVEISIDRVIEACQAALKQNAQLRKKSDRDWIVGIRKERLKRHRFFRKISFGLIRLPLLSNDSARNKISECLYSCFVFPSRVGFREDSACRRVLAACRASENGLITLSSLDAATLKIKKV